MNLIIIFDSHPRRITSQLSFTSRWNIDAIFIPCTECMYIDFVLDISWKHDSVCEYLEK